MSIFHTQKMTRARRSSYGLIVLLASLFVLTACTTEDAPETAEVQALVEGLVVSTASDLSGASLLDGSVVKGDVYISIKDLQSAQHVEYHLDDVEGLGLAYQKKTIDKLQPASGSTALNTRELADGVHTVSAKVHNAGQENTLTATFLVDNNATQTNELLVSQRADRTGAVALEGEKLSGDAHIFVVPSSRVKQVAFYVDDTNRRAAPYRVERYVFYDLGATASSGKARPYSTGRLKDGRHTVTAEITYSSGSKKVISSSFTVANEGGNDSGPAPKPLPDNWQNRDIGSVKVKGSFDKSGDRMTLKGSGEDIWSTKDQFHYAYQSLSGDGQFIAKVESLQKTDGWAKAGLMIRKDLSADSPNMAAFVTPDHGSVSQTRLREGVRTYSTVKGERHPWLKVSRKGDRLETYSSSNGRDWKRLSTATISLGSSAVIGLAVTSHTNRTAAQAVFSNVSFSGSAPSPAPEPTPPPGYAPAKGDYELRGDPNFSLSQLSSEQRKWYLNLWEAIDHPDQFPHSTQAAKSDDIYAYRGVLQSHVTSLLMAFRLTGDLRLLDEVDRLAQLMRAELADAWRDTKDGTNGTKDGYLNWVDRHYPKAKYAGKDTHRSYEMKAHALVALMAWALHNNRDLKSPSGVDYGAHADFWENYLVEHFEAKWREREGQRSGFPFISHFDFHAYHSWMRWHHYMGRLTGKSAYTKEAERMADVLWDKEFKETSSDYGTAIVWPRGVLSITAPHNMYLVDFMAPQTYARYIALEAVDLHFEGFHEYAKTSTMQKFANTVADFVINDNSFRSFARDIGGGRSRAGIKASDSSDWGDFNRTRYAISAWSFLAAWDKNSNDRILRASKEVNYDVANVKYGVKQRRVFIPLGMLIEEMY